LADQFLRCASHLIVTLKTKLRAKQGPIAPASHSKPGPAPGSPVSYWLALHEDVNKLVLQSGHDDAELDVATLSQGHQTSGSREILGNQAASAAAQCDRVSERGGFMIWFAVLHNGSIAIVAIP
jgi:hypothetical protein